MASTKEERGKGVECPNEHTVPVVIPDCDECGSVAEVFCCTCDNYFCRDCREGHTIEED